MKMRTQRLLAALLAVTILCGSLGSWCVIKVVAWARDLPNRIVIDVDGFGEAFGNAMVQSYHQALRSGDPPTQRQVMREFSALVVKNAEAQEWVRTEYTSDLKQLASSSNAGVAADAANLLTQISESQGDAQDSNGPFSPGR